MEIVLLEKVEKLGQMGDVIRVRPGYARNYLIPRRKALRATKSNLDFFRQKRLQFEEFNIRLREEAIELSLKMDGLFLCVIRQAGESGQLYGSVTARDISEAITAIGFSIQRTQVLLGKVIKTLGITIVRIILHPEVFISVTVMVARSLVEAEESQKQLIL